MHPTYSFSLASPQPANAPSSAGEPLPLEVMPNASVAPVSFVPGGDFGWPGGAYSSSSPEPAEPPQGVQGVFQNYYWQAYVGYTYVRFFEIPGTQVNTNGFNFSVQYYLKNWLAADGEFVATFGSQFGSTADYLMGLGGLRIRKAGPRGLEIWAHVLGGGSHYTPQTSYGNQHSVAYEVGGGVDIDAHHHRMAYRVSVDAAGTNYFNTYQVSPKVSAGVVFKF